MTRPLHIMLADSVRMWGGAQKWVVELAEGLASRGTWSAMPLRKQAALSLRRSSPLAATPPATTILSTL